LTDLVFVSAFELLRRSWRGAHLYFSHVEGGLHFLTPALLETEAGLGVGRRLGNADRSMAPHGVYPGRPTTDPDPGALDAGVPDARDPHTGGPGASSHAGGPGTANPHTGGPHASDDDDPTGRWLAIACATDEQWRALAGLLGRPDLAHLDVTSRLARQGELDELIAAWSSTVDVEAAQELLQRHGIPAHQVQNSPECVADGQLAHRDHFTRVCHPVHGHSWAEQYGFRLSHTPGRPTHAGPTWGEHNEHVLVDLLGYDDARLAALAVAGALE
jgi:benzylsuccinate CoA-transferase BbsF subunit